MVKGFWKEKFSKIAVIKPKYSYFTAICFIALYWIILWGSSIAQIIYNPNDERFRQLALEKCVWTYRENRDVYNRAIRLKDKDLISDAEYISIEREYKIAEIELKQALLALTQEAPHIAVERAITHRDSAGRITIEIVLKNLSQVSESIEIDSLFSEIAGDISINDISTLRNVFVSLKDNGVIIALPYERRIDILYPGDSVSLEFELLRDLEQVEVYAQYSGKMETKQILIQKGTGTAALQISSSPMAQEAAYASTASYLMQFDRGTDEAIGYDLRIEGLPELFQANFIDVATQARVSKLIFSPASLSHQLTLEVHLPDRKTETGPAADSLLRFTVAAVSTIDENRQSRIELELVPIGIGEITLRADNWQYNGTIKQPPILNIVARNTGSVELKDIRWDVDMPAGWQADIKPPNIEILKPGDEVISQISIILPPDEFQGDYEINIRAFTIYAGRHIDSGRKTFRIELHSTSNRVIIWVILLGIIIISAAAWLGIRINKR